LDEWFLISCGIRVLVIIRKKWRKNNKIFASVFTPSAHARAAAARSAAGSLFLAENGLNNSTAITEFWRKSADFF